MSDEFYDQMSEYQKLMNLMYDPKTVILDTETTGLHRGEIVQIAIINMEGETLLDTLVRPNKPIPPDASAIHGITDDMVALAPTWQTVSAQVRSILYTNTVIVYNAVYDRKMMHQSAEAWNMPKIDWKSHTDFVCAMEAYAEFWGDWNDYRHSFAWQKLTNAMKQQNLPVSNAHTALGDCLMTLALCKKMHQSHLEKTE